MAIGKLCIINPKLILIKLHFLFMFGGLGGSLPFVVLLGKSLNINATAIGLCFTAIMCLVLLTTPIMGSLVDYCQNMKWFLIGLAVVTAITNLSLLFIPPISRDLHEIESRELNISYLPENLMTVPPHDEDCLEFPEMDCSIPFAKRNESESVSEYKWESIKAKTIKGFIFTESINSSIKNNDTLEIGDSTVNSNVTQVVLETRNFTSKNQSNMQSPLQERECSTSVYYSYQFWVFAFLVVLGGLAYSNAISLSTVACYEILDNQRQLYGSQRLFGAIGWATVCLLSGFLNDISSENKAKKDYSPGFYLMGALLTIDLLIMSKMPLMKAKFSTDMLGDLKKVIRSLNRVLFAIGVTFIGILTTIVSNYEFWHLQDLGASQTLMGASIVMQCSSESSVFMISSWIVKKLGSFNCLVLSFVGFTIRCGLYSAIYNPWWALLIDTTHGLTFALFHFAMTNFASESAPAGTEATVLGILTGISTGLGAAIGNVLAGAALDRFGSRLMFRFSSIFSGVCGVCFLILPRFINTRKSASNTPHVCKSGDIKEDCV